MVLGFDLFFALFNNLAIFIALITLYRLIYGRFMNSSWTIRQVVMGCCFGLFAIGCMHAKIPVYEGVIVDQRNAIVILSGAFGGPLSALISALFAGGYRAYLGGGGVLGGIIGVSLAALAGTILHYIPGSFSSVWRVAASALFATVVILPGFLFIEDLAAGWTLMVNMSLPYGTAIFCAIFLVGILLNREQERHAFDVAFRESEKRYRDLIEGTEDLVMQTDKDGMITFVNHISEAFFGYPPEKCVGMSAWSFVHPEDHGRVKAELGDAVARKLKQLRLENRVLNAKTGEMMILVWSVTLHYDESWEYAGSGSIARNYTEQMKMQQMMVQTEKMISLGGISAGVAHEINNPLGIIFQASQNLMQRSLPNFPKNIQVAEEIGLDIKLFHKYMKARKLDVFITDIHRAAMRASEIIKRMLHFSRKTESHRTACNIQAIIDGAVALASSDFDLKKSYDFKKVTVNVSIEKNLPQFKCIETEIEQVILNLLRNAAQAMSEVSPLRENPRIDIRVMKKESFIRIEVEDNGPGMTEEVQKRIMEPFFTTKDPGSGTGLGLSVSYFIVTNGHDGQFYVTSEPGKGTIFTMDLPTG